MTQPIISYSFVTESKGPKLLQQLDALARGRGYSEAAAAELVAWCKSFILYQGKRHPQEMGRVEIGRYLEHIVGVKADPLAALDAARQALEFLYQELLQRDVGELPWPRPPRLLDQVRQVLRVKHYARRTEECYVQWIRRYIVHHGKRHPRDMGKAEVAQFLTDLAVEGEVSASTQNQALNALVFLYSQVLGIELGRFEAVRARRGRRLPEVMSASEVQRVLACVEGGEGIFALMAKLLYGCGLRLMEDCRLRVKDVSLDRNQIMVRGGKGDKDRVVMLPRSVRVELERHLERRREMHDGPPWVAVPGEVSAAAKQPAAKARRVRRHGMPSRQCIV